MDRIRDDGQRTLSSSTDARLRSLLSPTITVVVVSASAVLLALMVYGPAVVGDYGRLDDYAYVASSSRGTLDGLRSFYLDSGRPFPAFLMTSVAPQIYTVDALVWFRLASTVMVALGAATAALLTLRLTAPAPRVTATVLAACAAAAALSTTSSPSTVTWAILAGSAIAFPAAMAAGIVATSSLRFWWVPATILVLIAAFSYQHIAPIAVLPTLLWSTERWASRRPAQWSRTLIVGSITVAALVADFALVRSRDGAGTARVGTASTSERLHWFATEFLPQTLDVTVPGTATSLATSLVLLAVLLLMPILAGRRYLACSAAVLIAWAGTSMVVIPVELWASYRLASGAQFVLWVGAAACLAIGVARAKKPAVGAAVATGGAALAVFAVVVAGQRATNYLAAPNEVDWQSMQCVAEEHDLTKGSRIVMNSWYDSTSPVLDMDEYGIIGSSVPWSFPPAMWLAAGSSGAGTEPSFVPEELEVIPPGGDATGALVVSQDACGSAAGATP